MLLNIEAAMGTEEVIQLKSDEHELEEISQIVVTQE